MASITVKGFIAVNMETCSDSAFAEMGRSKAEKLFDYVSRGEVLKVKSFLRKHRHDRRIDVNAALPDRMHCHQDGTLLHVACACGYDAMVRVLMKHGARADVQDANGDTPLHLALRRALHGHKHAFEDIVLPILGRINSPDVLDIANKRGRTSRQLLNDLEQMSQERVQEAQRIFEARREAESRCRQEEEWNARLQDEWASEMTGVWDPPTTWEESGYDRHNQESFDEWATRIAAERRQKQQRQCDEDHPSSSHRRRKQARDQEQQQQEKRNFQRKLEEEHQRYKRRHSERLRKKMVKRKALYEDKCCEVFGTNDSTSSELRFEDIPWPSQDGDAAEMIQVLLCDVDRNDETVLRKFLRSQQLLWHPDKFVQKCGGRLVEADRERIMKRVTQLSQALNQLAEDKNAK